MIRLPPIPAAVLAALVLGSPTLAQVSAVSNTVHNLSASGSGVVRSDQEDEVCVFCHTPHGASAEGPLWNRSASAQAYTPYDSPSLQANPGQPTGPSKLCLSCHDGSIALGNVLNYPGNVASITVQNTGAGGVMPAGSGLIGTNLTNDHPVSFEYTSALAGDDQELAFPGAAVSSGLPLFPRGGGTTLQCVTCHDPHLEAPAKFLRIEPRQQSGNLCLTCHEKQGWPGSTHEASALDWPAGQGVTQVSDHSCMACHSPHTSQGSERLLRNGALAGESAIEQTCYECHQAAPTGIAPDIQGEFAKAWSHPIELSPGGHRPVFIPRPGMGLPENVALDPGSAAEDTRFTDTRHVECVDCHNPHRVTAANRTEGMRGIGLGGTEVANVQTLVAPPADGVDNDEMYPVCLRCHGDTYDQAIGTTPLASGALPSNKRVEFQRTNSSFHPVSGPGRNRSTNLNAQLTGAGLSTNSVIECTDCHNSNAYENTSGRVPASGTTNASPAGPHGSTYASLLRAPYWTDLPGPANWNQNNFKLCFQCHAVAGLVTNDRQDRGSRTNFYDDIDGRDNLHLVHLDDRSDLARATCKSCHYNIHSNQEAPNTIYVIDGVQYDGSPPSSFPTRLVNFHPAIQGTGGFSKPRWSYNTGNRTRTCNLVCHGEDGSPGGGEVMNFSYRPTSAGVDVPIN